MGSKGSKPETMLMGARSLSSIVAISPVALISVAYLTRESGPCTSMLTTEKVPYETACIFETVALRNPHVRSRVGINPRLELFMIYDVP